VKRSGVWVRADQDAVEEEREVEQVEEASARASDAMGCVEV